MNIEQLEEQAKNADPAVRAQVAVNPHTPPEVLRELFNDEDDTVSLWASFNPNSPEGVPAPHEMMEEVAGLHSTPPEVLYILSLSCNLAVNLEVARNINASPDTLTELGTLDDVVDEFWFVREAVAQNPNSPASLLSLLAADENVEVLRAVAKNPNTPAETLNMLGTGNSAVRYLVASNPSTPIEVLEVLAVDENPRVRAGVAYNPSVPVSLMEQLAVDDDWFVRSAVETIKK